jgi:hypothetical protein
MTPTPKTVEATVRLDDKLAANLTEGSIIQAGPDGAKFQIISTTTPKEIQATQGDLPYGSMSFIAVLANCAAISRRRKTAVIKTSVSLTEIYSACGATAVIASDFTVARFACFVGGVPSYGIAQLLQEEAGGLYWDGSKIQFIRLPDIFKQTPAATLAQDTTTDIYSDFMQLHEVPFFYSTADDGSIIYGNRTDSRAARYMPRSDVRVLANMTRVLVQKKILMSSINLNINGGSMIMVEKTPYAVVTAAHVEERGGDGGSANAYSKFWLATLETGS